MDNLISAPPHVQRGFAKLRQALAAEAEAQRIINEAKQRIEVIARSQVHGGTRPTMRFESATDAEKSHQETGEEAQGISVPQNAAGSSIVVV